MDWPIGRASGSWIINETSDSLYNPPAFRVVQIQHGYTARAVSYHRQDFHLAIALSSPRHAFSIVKDLDSKRLSIEIRSPFLRDILSLRDSFTLDFSNIASRYQYLQEKLRASADRLLEPSSYQTHLTRLMNRCQFRDLRLLVEGFLQARHIFHGFDLRQFYDRGIISKTHWQDLQHSSANFDLDLVDHAFQRCIQGLALKYELSKPLPAAPSDPTSQCYLVYTRAQCIQRVSSMNHSIRCSLDELEEWSEGWSQPIMVENCLLWSLDDAPNATPEERLFLDLIMSECQNSLQIKELVCHTRPKDTSCPYNIFIIFEGWGEEQLKSAELHLSPEFRSLRRLTGVEKKELITQRLHAAFKAEDRRFRSKVTTIDSHNPSAGVSRQYQFINQWYYKAWNKGIATIRRFLDGKRPGTLEQIIRLLQVAYAMGSQDHTNPNFSTTFTDDLARWRTIVPPHSLHWFDAIVETVWNRTFETSNCDMGPEYASNETLVQLQDLLSGLISQCPLVNMPQTENQQDDQSREDGSSFNSAVDVNYVVVQEVLGGIKDPRAYADTRKLPNGAQRPDPVLMLMMVGAIFGFIYSFFVILQSCEFPTLAPNAAEGQFRHFANYLERNLFMLCLYMGCSPLPNYQENQRQDTREDVSMKESTSVHSSAPATEVSPNPIEIELQSSVQTLQCDRCSRTFSNKGNLNRHRRGDCERKAQFPCRNPGCRTVVSRKAYRDKHELLRCPWRPSTRHNISNLDDTHMINGQDFDSIML